MAKFGQMCLNGGLWQNRRIVSKAWLAEQKAHFHFEGNDRFFMPSPIFGNMNGRILRDDHKKPNGLLINTAFSELRFIKSD
jgi:hypothetical protein